MSTQISGGRLRGQIVDTPNGEKTRPTSNKTRQALFNILGQNFSGLILYDVYAGSGSVGFEALSRGANKVVFVESSELVCQIIQSNTLKFELGPQVQIINNSANDFFKSFLEGAVEDNTILFLDPPFDIVFPDLGYIVAQKNRFDSIVIQYPTSLKANWLKSASKIKKYGVSSLAIFES